MLDLILMGEYAFLGAGIKYIDDAYDENTFSKKTANIIAISCTLIMGYLMATDSTSTIIFLGMIIALIITKKINNHAFIAGIIGIFTIQLLFNQSMHIELIPLSTIIITGIADEKGNDFADNRKLKGITRKFFDYRCAMKVGVLGLCAAGFFSFIYFIAFMLFDIAYYAVKVYSSNTAAKRSSH